MVSFRGTVGDERTLPPYLDFHHPQFQLPTKYGSDIPLSLTSPLIDRMAAAAFSVYRAKGESRRQQSRVEQSGIF